VAKNVWSHPQEGVNELMEIVDGIAMEAARS